MTNIHLGRHVYGLAAIAFGIITLVWRDFSTWQQNIPRQAIVLYLVAVVEIFGGLTIQWPKTVRVGAIALGCLYMIFAFSWVPRIVAEPTVYDRWGNFFEQFSLVAGALIVFASVGKNHSEQPPKAARIGYLFFGICVISFTLEQLFYLSGTASFVPKWIPLGQMFWAVATTIAMGLAAIALLSGRVALLASRLLTAMIVGFGLFVWLPTPFSDPHKLFSWAGNVQNLAITGAAWIVSDFLGQSRSAELDSLPQAAGEEVGS
jgi:uncharacterized membrane protein YphA (DoxX/SURF4 family)